MLILQYNRSRLNYFQFFMQKLSHKSIYNLYKSFSSLHKETNKFGFIFFWFFFNFYGIYKSLDKTTKKDRIYLQESPQEVSLHRNALGHKNSHNQAPGGGGELAASEVGRGGQQMSLSCKWAHPWSIAVLGEAGDAAGERRWRSSGNTAALAQCPARWGAKCSEHGPICH
jgi:hypothetical protein